MIFFLCNGDFCKIERIRKQKYIDALWFMNKISQKQKQENEKTIIEKDEF